MDEKIFKYLYWIKEPQTIYKISKNLKLPISSVKYCIKKMVKSGVIIELQDRNRRVYGLHPMFFDETFWKQYIHELQKVMRLFLECSQKYKDLSDTEFDIIYLLQLLIKILV